MIVFGNRTGSIGSRSGTHWQATQAILKLSFCIFLLFVMPPGNDDVESRRHGPRLLGIICRNPNCRKTFKNVHAYNRYRRSPRVANTLCASITSMFERVAEDRANASTAYLHPEPVMTN